MTRAVFLIATLSLLLGCAPDPRSVQLADVDLSDMSTVQGIRSQLTAFEGAAFANYLVKHRSASAHFCGHKLVGPEGNPPVTVGEAINFTLAKDAEDRRALEIATRLKPFWELEQQRRDLTDRRDMLVDVQSRLRAEHGAAAERFKQWRSIDASLAEVNRRLVELKPKISAAGE